MKHLIVTAVFLFIISIIKADVYYIDGINGNDSNNGLTLTTAWKTIQKANQTLQAGDTVYFREGIYYPTGRNDCIHPYQSGTRGNRIVYENYNEESVTIDGSNSNYEAILFSQGWNTGNPSDGRSYITVKGINFANWNKLADLYYASYNEIANCEFSGHKDDGMNISYISFEMSHKSTHNWIHGNTWHTFGFYTANRDAGVLFNIGFDVSADTVNSGNNYNTVENNHFYSSGHHVVGINNGKYNVVRNNYIHNEGWSTTGGCSDWSTGKCGYRVMYMVNNNDQNLGGTNLIEDNSISYGAQYGGPHTMPYGSSGSGLTIHTDSNIVRYNKFIGNVGFGIRFGSSMPQNSAYCNRVYNNTIYYSGYNLDSWDVVNEDDPSLYDDIRCALSFYAISCDDGRDVINNVIKNNLAHETWSETNNLSSSSYYPAFYEAGVGSCNLIENNWGNSGNSQQSPFTPYPDPMFVDPDISDPMALSLVNGKWAGKPDLSLQASSPVIDQAAHLTQANGTDSNSTTLKVNDARYFQDGSWGSDLARATLQADCIAIGTVSNTVQISSIDYNTNIITLISPMSWSDEASVWLYKKSNGQVVLFGAAPDYGAHELNKEEIPTDTTF